MAFTLPELPYPLRRARPLHVARDAGIPSRQAPPRLRDQRQQPRQRHRVGEQAGRGSRQRHLRQERRPLQQCRPALQPHPFLEVDEEGRRRRQDPRQARKADHVRHRPDRKDEGRFHPGRRHPVRLGLVLARGQGRQARHHEDAERRESAGARRASRSSAATCGSIPITSTIATGGPITSRRSSTIWSIGTTSPRCTKRRRNRRRHDHARAKAGPRAPLFATGTRPAPVPAALPFCRIVPDAIAPHCMRFAADAHLRPGQSCTNPRRSRYPCRRGDRSRAPAGCAAPSACWCSPRVIAAATFRDYGLGWDDYTHSQYGDLLVALYSSGFADKRALSFVNLYMYGGGFDLFAALAAKILPFGLFETRRLVGAAVGIVGLFVDLAARPAARRPARRPDRARSCSPPARSTTAICSSTPRMGRSRSPCVIALLGIVRAFEEYPQRDAGDRRARAASASGLPSARASWAASRCSTRCCRCCSSLPFDRAQRGLKPALARVRLIPPRIHSRRRSWPIWSWAWSGRGASSRRSIRFVPSNIFPLSSKSRGASCSTAN